MKEILLGLFPNIIMTSCHHRERSSFAFLRFLSPLLLVATVTTTASGLIYFSANAADPVDHERYAPVPSSSSQQQRQMPQQQQPPPPPPPPQQQKNPQRQQWQWQFAWSSSSATAGANRTHGGGTRELVAPACASETRAEAWSDENVERVADAWELRQEETDALVALGGRLEDLDYYRNRPSDVVRFLIQKKFDLNAAEAMVRSNFAWRMRNGVDTILRDFDPPEGLLEHYPAAVLKGVDRDGDPVFVGRAGVTDGVGLLERFGRDTMIKHAIWERENVWSGDWIRQWEEQSGRPLTRLTIIEDAEGLDLIRTIFSRRLMDAFGEVMRIDRENYPQTVKKFLVIRVPRIFEAIWNVIARMLDPTAVARTSFSSPTRYVQHLSEVVDLEVLPEEIVPGVGKGEARDGFPSSFKGGPVPVE